MCIKYHIENVLLRFFVSITSMFFFSIFVVDKALKKHVRHVFKGVKMEIIRCFSLCFYALSFWFLHYLHFYHLSLVLFLYSPLFFVTFLFNARKRSQVPLSYNWGDTFLLQCPRRYFCPCRIL